jgi:hypothetical protein
MSSFRGADPSVAVNWAEKVRLGESEQWLLPQGSNARNPVLLILAGGSSISMMVATRRMWILRIHDQHGAGNS